MEQAPDTTAQLLALLQQQLAAQSDQIAVLTASQAKASEKPEPEDKGGVLVRQRRLIMNEGNRIEEHDVQEQYYPADVYERMTREVEGKTAFDNIGYAAPEIIKDTRKKKK